MITSKETQSHSTVSYLRLEHLLINGRLSIQIVLTVCFEVPVTPDAGQIRGSQRIGIDNNSVPVGMCFEVAGTLIGVLVYTAYYIGLASSSTADCDEGERVPDLDMRAAFRWHGLTLGILVVVFVFVTFIGVKEQNGTAKILMLVRVSNMSQIQ